MQSSRWHSLAAIFILPLLFAGCASVQVAKDAQGTGVKRTYQKPVSEVWSAMRNAVLKTGGVIKEENEGTCSILAEYGIGLFSWGERVGVFCKPIAAEQTETEVVSKRAVSMNVTASDWTQKIYGQIDAELK